MFDYNNKTEEMSISGVFAVQIKNVVSFIKVHLAKVANEKLPDHRISQCLNIDDFADLNSTIGKQATATTIKIPSKMATTLCSCFLVVNKVIKSTYGEELFNEVLNKGHKKSSKKEFHFLSREWINIDLMCAEEIYKNLPEVEEKMDDLAPCVSNISL